MNDRTTLNIKVTKDLDGFGYPQAHTQWNKELNWYDDYKYPKIGSYNATSFSSPPAMVDLLISTNIHA